MKKIISILAIVSIMACCLVGCSKINPDPMKAARNAVKNGVDYVDISVDEDSIEAMVEKFDVDADDVYCILTLRDGSDYAVVVYCNKAKAAKDIQKELKDQLEDMDDDEAEDVNVIRSGKVVFAGSEDLL